MVDLNKVKSENGVTVIVLVFAILILTLISTTVIYRAISSFSLRRYNKVNQDLVLLQDEVSDYYAKQGDIPKLMEYQNVPIPSDKLDPLETLDSYVYYVIDIDKLENKKLNYGSDYKKLKSGAEITKIKNDVYIINAQTYNIYYVQGVELAGTTYYKLDGNASKINKIGYTSAPILKDGMTPISWNETNSTWDDVNKYDENWYDYYAQNPKWANARTEDGSMWVWVPRYEYKISDNKIETKFIPVTQVEADEGYEIQMAFRAKYLQGGSNKELSGIWVAKYETGMEENSDSGWNSKVPTSETDGNCLTSENLNVRAVSKSNVGSWRYISINNAYLNALNYNKDYNSHLIKNSEWGAVAYLSYGNYGTNGNEITPNLSSYVTGTNVNQSSNKNMTGIFDLSGGTSEFVAAYYNDATDLTNVNKIVEGKNNYVTAYTEEHLYYLGDATRETKGWNQDYANEMDLNNPCLVRGGSCINSTSTGIFAYNKDLGISSEGKGYRMVLTTEENNSIYTAVVDNTEIPVPNGFKISEVSGEKNLADGIVIKDSEDNEFVWVPCSVEEYKKIYNKGISYDDYNLSDDKNSKDKKINELAQISKYGGFYVSRYEAGIPQNKTTGENEINKPVSKKNTKTWTNISYNNAQSSAERMYMGESFKSGLITGTQWDVITKIMYDSTEDAINIWGNYSDTTSGGTIRNTGSISNWNKKNIFDFAGNAWEWNEEIYSSSNNKVTRGGSFLNSSTSYPIEYRNQQDMNTLKDNIGFRVVLYLDTTLEDEKPCAPNLAEGMIPVKWNGNNWIICSKTDSDWYEYKNQIAGTDGLSKWANMMLSDGKYKQGQNDVIGTKIDQKDLGSMFVWIPRFEYKINSDNNEIYTKFININQIEPDKDYDHIHPAFRNGTSNNFKNGEWDKEIGGFWIAKYEAGFQACTLDGSDSNNIINSSDTINYSNWNYYLVDTDTVSNHINALSQNVNDTPKISEPVFKPLTYSFNEINVGNIMDVSNSVANNKIFYGLKSTLTNSHMLKNSEWGATVYLAHSSYGRNGTLISSNTKDLSGHSNLDSKNICTVTGYSENEANGVSASTTNNMTGVFDLNGGAGEAVAGYVFFEEYYQTGSTKNTTIYPVNAGNDTSSGNYEKYKSNMTYLNCFGDAILETSTEGERNTSWYGEYSVFPYGTNTFIVRGGIEKDDMKQGIFAYEASNGIESKNMGFRIAIINN